VVDRESAVFIGLSQHHGCLKNMVIPRPPDDLYIDGKRKAYGTITTVSLEVFLSPKNTELGFKMFQGRVSIRWFPKIGVPLFITHFRLGFSMK